MAIRTPIAWFTIWPGIAVHQAERHHFAVDRRVVDGVGGEDSGQQRAQRSARAVDAESIERIVIAEHVFDRGDHPEAEDTREQTRSAAPASVSRNRMRA